MDNFTRDKSSGAILNKDVSEIEKARTRKKNSRKVSSLEDRINTLERQYQELSELIKRLK
jgi:hypothetical protein